MSDRAIQALWYVGEGRAELRAENVATPAQGELRLRARQIGHPDAALEPLKKTAAGALDNHDQQSIAVAAQFHVAKEAGRV